MKYMRLFLVAASVWTYGSEPLDTIMDNIEYITFMRQLQCHTIENHVWCKLDDGTEATIENQPLQTPWGVS